MVSIVFVSWRSSLKCIRITARLLGYETGVDIPTYVVRNNAKSLLKRYNRLPTGAYSVEDGRVTDDDSETRQGEAKQEEKHLGRSAKAGVQVHHQREFPVAEPALSVPFDCAGEGLPVFPKSAPH